MIWDTRNLSLKKEEGGDNFKNMENNRGKMLKNGEQMGHYYEEKLSKTKGELPLTLNHRKEKISRRCIKQSSKKKAEIKQQGETYEHRNFQNKMQRKNQTKMCHHRMLVGLTLHRVPECVSANDDMTQPAIAAPRWRKEKRKKKKKD